MKDNLGYEYYIKNGMKFYKIHKKYEPRINKYKSMRIAGKNIQEHRYLMENKLGRKLREDEIVHHIDGNPRNNDIANLKIMKLSDHTKLHHLGKGDYDKSAKYRRINREAIYPKFICPICKIDITKMSAYKRRIHKRQCYILSRI